MFKHTENEEDGGAKEEVVYYSSMPPITENVEDLLQKQLQIHEKIIYPLNHQEERVNDSLNNSIDTYIRVNQDVNNAYFQKQQELQNNIILPDVPPGFEGIPPRQQRHIHVNNNNKKKKNNNNNNNRRKRKSKQNTERRCYSCHPRNSLLRYFILQKNDVKFHFDIKQTNCIIAIPKRHFQSLSESSNEEMGNLLMTIESFCQDWKIKDYNIFFNQGNWQNHQHFCVKIRTYQNQVERMRKLHFEYLKLQQIYYG